MKKRLTIIVLLITAMTICLKASVPAQWTNTQNKTSCAKIDLSLAEAFQPERQHIECSLYKGKTQTFTKKQVEKLAGFGAICSFILALCSTAFAWAPLYGFILSVTAFLLGYLLLKKTKKRRRYAVAGFLLGGLLTTIWGIVLIVISQK